MTDPLLQELRERFRETSRARLEEMAPLLARCQEIEAVQKLARHFHAFSGLGATYGFPRLSELGDEAEASILPLARRGELPTEQQVAQWRALVGEITRALEVDLEQQAINTDASTAAAPRRIVAVEDDETHAVLITHILARAGYEVVVCSGPEEFEELLSRFEPDLLLTDIQLANDERGGYEVVRRMRERERLRDVPVIYVSGDRDVEISGGDACLIKPVDWNALLTLIESRLA